MAFTYSKIPGMLSINKFFAPAGWYVNISLHRLLSLPMPRFLFLLYFQLSFCVCRRQYHLFFSSYLNGQTFKRLKLVADVMLQVHSLPTCLSASSHRHSSSRGFQSTASSILYCFVLVFVVKVNRHRHTDLDAVDIVHDQDDSANNAE